MSLPRLRDADAPWVWGVGGISKFEMRKLEIGECEGEKVGKWFWGVGDSDLGFWMFNFPQQLRDTLMRGFFTSFPV